MTHFDECQRFLRYKYGFHSFLIVVVLSAFNFSMSSIWSIQWAETKEAEYLFLLSIAVFYSFIMSIYKGAYFHKNETPAFTIPLFLLSSFLYLDTSLSSPLLSDGKLTMRGLYLLFAIMWFSGAILYVVKALIDKRRDKNDLD